MVRVRVKSEKRSHSKCIGFVLCTTEKPEKRSHSFTFCSVDNRALGRDSID